MPRKAVKVDKGSGAGQAAERQRQNSCKTAAEADHAPAERPEDHEISYASFSIDIWPNFGQQS